MAPVDPAAPTPPYPPPVIAPEVSPTGKALVPPKLVPYVVALVGVAAALVAAPMAGIHLPAIVTNVAALVVLLAPVFGVASPGLRGKAP